MIDRNSITGIILICAIMFLWMWYESPGKEELKKRKKMRDSLALVEKQKTNGSIFSDTSSLSADTVHSTILAADSLFRTDSAKTAALINQYDVFASAASGKDTFFTMENELLKVTVSSKGGRISSVLLKNYQRHDSAALVLFDADSSSFGLLFDTENNRTIRTGELYFSAAGTSFEVKGDEKNKIALRLYASSDSTGQSTRYIEYEYSLSGNSYAVDCRLNITGMNDVIASNLSEMSLHWAMKTPSQEKDLENQRNSSTIYFRYMEEEPDYLNEMSNETKTLNARTKWVAFKQQFFTSVLMADDYFDKTGAEISSLNETQSTKYVKSFSANLTIPYLHHEKESFGMKFYFGPNHFQTLKKYELGLEKQIPLGWGIFGWVNRFLVIPVFNFLDSFNINYAIIILVLTLVFKTLLFPVAWKTYVASAKMRILKPEIDELGKKFANDEPLKKQQAMMALYRKAGVNPLAGCIPALLQLPILIALFRFFPSSIELRQQGFWWVTDLSTYDSVFDFGKVPDLINFIYGDHISLWALLCTGTTLLYTHLNSQMMSSPGNEQQAKMMKYMIYIMPVIFLPFLNKFSAGLSYYYTISNLISFGQMYIIRKYIVDENKLRKKIDEHKKKPPKPLSSFQQRLQKKMEDLQKQRNGMGRQKMKK